MFFWLITKKDPLKQLRRIPKKILGKLFTGASAPFSAGAFSLSNILDIDKDTANQMIIGTPVELIHEGTVVAQLTPNDFYNCDRNAVSQTIFGTEDISHPGVEHFFSLKEIFVGGSIKL